jgi:hypothetical protein
MVRSLALILAIACHAPPAAANFHLWEVMEIFSSGDGSIQFVEFFTESADQQVLIGHTLETYQQDVMREQFTFPTSIPLPQGGTTANQHFLVATPGFIAVAGIAPDYEIPVGFLEPRIIDEVALVGADDMNFAAAALPTDGVNSLNDPGGGDPVFAAAATPTNFAGEVGQIVPEPGAALAGLVAFACLASLSLRVAPRAD